jgi:hypothetical protein
MPIIINDKIYSDVTADSITVMLQHVMTLPQPKVLPFSASARVQADNTLIHVQKEMVCVDLQHPANSIRYIGTKGLYTCLQVYIYNERHCFAIHIDLTNDFNLMEALKPFVGSACEMMILGADSRDEFSKTMALLEFKNFFMALAEAQKALKLTITVVAQKLLTHNVSTKEDVLLAQYDAILQKADLLLVRYYGLHLDFRAFAHRKPSDLATRSVPITEELIITLSILNFSEELMVAGDDFEGMIGYCRVVRNAINIGILPEIGEKSLDKVLVCYYRLINLIDQVFSQAGMDFLGASMTQPLVQLRNFVLDVTSKEIVIISQHQAALRSETETQRAIAIHDEFRSHPYRMFYHSEKPEFILPIHSDKFLALCQEFARFISKSPLIPKAIVDQFMQSLRMPPVSKAYLIPIIKFCQTTFKALDCPFKDYYQETLHDTQNLQLLRLTFPDLLIEGKTRKDREYQLDALIACSSITQAEMVKARLAERGIKSEVWHGRKNVILSVPYINGAEQASKIALLHTPTVFWSRPLAQKLLTTTELSPAAAH